MARAATAPAMDRAGTVSGPDSQEVPGVLAFDVGYRNGGWVRLDFDGRLLWGVLTTAAAPPKKVRVPGELQAHDDSTIGQMYQDLVDLIGSDRALRGVLYEVPGGMQGARALETMAFARASLVCATRRWGYPISRVTAFESDRQVNGPQPGRLVPLVKPMAGSPADVVANYERLLKERKRLKDGARKARKQRTARAMERAFPELRGISETESGWSHVCDAAAVLIAEATVGRSLRDWLPANVVGRLVDIGAVSRNLK